MRDFQVYLLDSGDHIIRREDIAAGSLEAAIQMGSKALQQNNLGAVAIEIWSGTQRLFTGNPTEAWQPQREFSG